MNHLSNSFYSLPDLARQTMTRKQVRETLLDTTGKILTCGRLRTLSTKHIGAGIYEVSLKKL